MTSRNFNLGRFRLEITVADVGGYVVEGNVDSSNPHNQQTIIVEETTDGSDLIEVQSLADIAVANAQQSLDSEAQNITDYISGL